MDTTLRKQLSRIDPVVLPAGMPVYPCSARLLGGELVSCVYFVEASDFRDGFGTSAPRQDTFISESDVASIDESACRLPARYANSIYRRGESGSGYYLFRFRFSWWSQRDYLIGGFVDFLRFPWHFNGRDVRQLDFYGIDRERVLRRQRRTQLPGVQFKWCIF